MGIIDLWQKVKKYKTEIIIVGGVIITIAGIVIITKNWDSIKKADITHLIKSRTKPEIKIIPISNEIVQNIIIESHNDVKCIDVCSHLRTLPDGWIASPEKVSSAIEYGFELAENQTWVSEYIKSCA